MATVTLWSYKGERNGGDRKERLKAKSSMDSLEKTTESNQMRCIFYCGFHQVIYCVRLKSRFSVESEVFTPFDRGCSTKM